MSKKTIEKVDWAGVFAKDPELLTSILAGVARNGSSKRNVLDYKTGNMKYAALSMEDFSENPFKRAVHILNRSGADLPDVNYDDPTVEEIKVVAEHFGRHPSYFLEYRIHFVLDSVSDFMKSNPETASAWFSKAYSARGIAIK